MCNVRVEGVAVGDIKYGITKRLQDRLAGESMTSKGYLYLSEISGYHISRLWHAQIEPR